MIHAESAYEFEWDDNNEWKTLSHDISNKEAEEAFFDNSKVLYNDVFHSHVEDRYILLGKTKQELLLYIVFTYRNTKIRIISARRINKKEVRFYEKKA